MCKRCGHNHQMQFVNTTDGLIEWCPYVEGAVEREANDAMKMSFILSVLLLSYWNYNPEEMFNSIVFILIGAIPLTLVMMIPVCIGTSIFRKFSK